MRPTPRCGPEIDEFAEYVRHDSPDPAPAVDAIVAAATVPGAPTRLPVAPDLDKRRADELETVARTFDAAAAFLSQHRA